MGAEFEHETMLFEGRFKDDCRRLLCLNSVRLAFLDNYFFLPQKTKKSRKKNSVYAVRSAQLFAWTQPLSDFCQATFIKTTSQFFPISLSTKAATKREGVSIKFKKPLTVNGPGSFGHTDCDDAAAAAAAVNASVAAAAAASVDRRNQRSEGNNHYGPTSDATSSLSPIVPFINHYGVINKPFTFRK